jgi:hypothetical protein
LTTIHAISLFKCSTHDAHTAHPIRTDNTFPSNPHQTFILLVPPIDSTRSSGHLFGRSCAALPHLIFLPETGRWASLCLAFSIGDCGKYTHRRATTYNAIPSYSGGSSLQLRVDRAHGLSPSFIPLYTPSISAFSVQFRDHIDSPGTSGVRSDSMGKFSTHCSISKERYLSIPELHARSPIYRSGHVCSLCTLNAVGLAFGGCSIFSLFVSFCVGFPAFLQLPPACTCMGQRCIQATGGL